MDTCIVYCASLQFEHYYTSHSAFSNFPWCYFSQFILVLNRAYLASSSWSVTISWCSALTSLSCVSIPSTPLIAIWRLSCTDVFMCCMCQIHPQLIYSTTTACTHTPLAACRQGYDCIHFQKACEVSAALSRSLGVEKSFDPCKQCCSEVCSKKPTWVWSVWGDQRTCMNPTEAA